MVLVFALALIETEADQSRFTHIYDTYCKQMLFAAQRVLRDPYLAEDAVQEALIGIAKRIRSIPEDPRVERAYVLTAARNAALSLLPEVKKRDATLDIDEMDASEDMLFEQIVRLQDYTLLRRAMAQLPQHYREVLMLVYVQEQSVRDTARLLCRPQGTIRQQLRRGKHALLELCRKEGLDFGEKSVTL